MTLMQIAEPGQSVAPHKERLAVGIDLGTTNSLVATVVNGSVEVIRDEAGRALLPSVVRYLPDGGVVVGTAALERQLDDPLNVISSAKRLIGRDGRDIVGAVILPYSFANEDGLIRIKTVAGPRTPIEVSAEILRVLVARAEDRLGGSLVGAVITVPAYFDDAQRQATKDAARLAGVNVLRLLNEPTAAALAYGLDNAAEGLYLIYDLGGGTFDVSLLELSKGVFEVLATGGDTALGGDDFDHRLVCWALEGLAGHGEGILSPRDKRRLSHAARQARESLTERDEAVIRLTLSDGRSIDKSLTRSAFEEMARPLLDKTIAALRAALAGAGRRPEEIKGVVLVGGATRMPCVRAAVRDFFGREPLSGIDPDQVVAVGAARQAAKLAGNVAGGDDWLLLDVTPLSLGVETMGSLVEKVIPRNTPIPVAMAQDFTTFKDGQTAMSIHVLQGEREVVDACRSLARFELRGIPPMAAGAARVRVTFQVDSDGLLSVSAREQRSGREASVRVRPSYGLSDEDILRMLREGTATAAADQRERSLREARIEGERLLESLRGALQADADLLEESESQRLEALRAELSAALSGDDPDIILTATKALAAASDPFAARRMDRAIRQALAGRDVSEVNI